VCRASLATKPLVYMYNEREYSDSDVGASMAGTMEKEPKKLN